MNVKIGGSPESWGIVSPDDPDRTKWNDFLDEVAEAGYKWIELGPYGYLPTDLTVLRSELNSRGLKISANWAMAHLEDPSAWTGLEKQVLGMGELLASLNAKFLILIDDTYTDQVTGERLKSNSLDKLEWKRLIDVTHKVANIAKDKFGLDLVFHPHVETHIENEGQIETFLEQTDSDIVGLCLDTGHFAYGNVDPISFMRRHSDRIPYLHLKNIDPEIQNRVKNENIPFATAVENGMFCEPWKGAVDFVAFRDVLHEVNYKGYAIFEQDMYPAPFEKPLPIAKRTREYLREIGIG